MNRRHRTISYSKTGSRSDIYRAEFTNSEYEGPEI
jgi:hypothetical protein